jgi:catechol 2,3-dioxygenase-like lactoylglutathione lyase family enzyme
MVRSISMSLRVLCAPCPPRSSSIPATGSATSIVRWRSTRHWASRSAAASRSATRRSTSSWGCRATATGYNHIALTVTDLEETLAALAEQGIEPEKPPYRVREGGSLLCFVRDPDGYRIELIERT